MNVTVLTAPPPAGLSADWRRLVPPVGVGLLLLGLLFSREVVSAVQTWDDSTAYNHCFLIVPIVTYLLWDRRQDVVGIAARPMPMAVLLGVPLAVVWLASERLGIMEGRQLVAVSFVEVLLLAVLGKRLWWAMAGPLLYLYFLVPFGAFLTPWLQDVTTFFIRHGLELLGVPAFIDGYVIEIPQGTFFVAEACAGLRFLIASVAFGCLYALLMYRSPVRRGVFMVVSIIVPIIANGIRGIGIVYLGYLLGSAEAAAADHIIYGWLFFSAVILVLIVLGLPFREDQLSTRSGSASVEVGAPSVSIGGVFALAIGVVVVAALSPAVAAGLTAAAGPVAVASRIEIGPTCRVEPRENVAIRSERVLCGDVAVDVSWAAFSPRSTAGPVMAARRRMVARVLSEGLQEGWLAPERGSPSGWRIMTSGDPAFAVAVSVWIDGKPVRPGLGMRLRMALNSLVGSAYAPMVVTVTPVVDWATRNGSALKTVDAALRRFLLTHPALDAAVEASSEQR